MSLRIDTFYKEEFIGGIPSSYITGSKVQLPSRGNPKKRKCDPLDAVGVNLQKQQRTHAPALNTRRITRNTCQFPDVLIWIEKKLDPSPISVSIQEYLAMGHFHERIMNGGTNLFIDGDYNFKTMLSQVFAKIASRPLGREFLLDITRLANFRIRICRVEDPIRTQFVYDPLNGHAIYLNLSEAEQFAQVIENDRSGDLELVKSPLYVIVLHELIHAWRTAVGMTQFDGIQKTECMPQKHWMNDNLEEEETICKENDFRVAFNLRKRFGHFGCSIPRTLDINSLETQYYFLNCCRYGIRGEVRKLLAMGIDATKPYIENGCALYPLQTCILGGHWKLVSEFIEQRPESFSAVDLATLTQVCELNQDNDWYLAAMPIPVASGIATNTSLA